jgi:predicted metal-dependent TIM-barrel fold hydrolase
MNANDHFQGLVTYLIANINQMLKNDNMITPIGLVANSDKSIKVVTANIETKKIIDHVNIIQTELKNKATVFEILSSCIAYPDYENNQIIAFLENNKNYCVKVLIPVVNRRGLKLDPEKLVTEAGSVDVFPVKNLH